MVKLKVNYVYLHISNDRVDPLYTLQNHSSVNGYFIDVAERKNVGGKIYC